MSKKVFAGCPKMQGVRIACILFVLATLLPCMAFADDQGVLKHSDNRTYFDETLLERHDKGYTGDKQIGVNDVHYAWKMGRFVVSGYSSWAKDSNGNYVFLKNEGDTISLSYILDQDIDALPGDCDAVVSDDKNGYDERLAVEKQDFGRGALLIEATDPENAKQVKVTCNYLNACSLGAENNIDFFEEGDYRAVLDYELRFDGPLPVKSSYHDYRVEFPFSIRNGNNMFFLMDSSTGSEIQNCSFTESGFKVDLANSKYLKLSVRREVLNDKTGRLENDTRFNRVVSDGDEFTEEGIYTITSSSEYSDLSTVKTIYVGSNPVMRAIVVNSMSLDEVKNAIAQGATVDEAGELTMPENNQESSNSANDSEQGFIDKVSSLF